MNKIKRKETYNSKGNSQDQNIGNRQNSLLPVLEVTAFVHIEPEDRRESD